MAERPCQYTTRDSSGNPIYRATLIYDKMNRLSTFKQSAGSEAFETLYGYDKDNRPAIEKEQRRSRYQARGAVRRADREPLRAYTYDAAWKDKLASYKGQYARTLDAEIDDASVSKSEVSRRFALGLEAQMEAFFKRPIEGNYPVVMIDGLALGAMTIVAAMGIVEGGSENSALVKSLLSDLVERGLSAVEPRLYVPDVARRCTKR